MNSTEISPRACASGDDERSRSFAAASAGWLSNQRKVATSEADYQTTLLARAGEDPELRRSLALGVDCTDPASLAEDLRATVAAAGKGSSVV